MKATAIIVALLTSCVFLSGGQGQESARNLKGRVIAYPVADRLLGKGGFIANGELLLAREEGREGLGSVVKLVSVDSKNTRVLKRFWRGLKAFACESQGTRNAMRPM
jgi:hypothetical protein